MTCEHNRQLMELFKFGVIAENKIGAPYSFGRRKLGLNAFFCLYFGETASHKPFELQFRARFDGCREIPIMLPIRFEQERNLRDKDGPGGFVFLFAVEECFADKGVNAIFERHTCGSICEYEFAETPAIG